MAYSSLYKRQRTAKICSTNPEFAFIVFVLRRFYLISLLIKRIPGVNAFANGQSDEFTSGKVLYIMKKHFNHMKSSLLLVILKRIQSSLYFEMQISGYHLNTEMI